MIYEISDLSFCYKKNQNLFSEVNLTFNEQNIIAVIGKNGCGKSTFLQLLAGIIRKYNGKILFKNQHFEKMTNRQIAMNLSYMGQSSFGNIPLSVKEVVKLGNFACGLENETKINNALDLLQIKNLEQNEFNKLSGGQKQKTMLARAICQNDKIMIFDEPTSALDIVAKEQVFEMLHSLTVDSNGLAIVATHDIELVKKYATKIIYFDKNKAYQITPTQLDDNLIKEIFL